MFELSRTGRFMLVIPADARIQPWLCAPAVESWIPAFAGMTVGGGGMPGWNNCNVTSEAPA